MRSRHVTRRRHSKTALRRGDAPPPPPRADKPEPVARPRLDRPVPGETESLLFEGERDLIARRGDPRDAGRE